MSKRGILIILDGVGIGPLPDAHVYGDSDSNTLAHMAKVTGGLKLPNLEKLGLGCIAPMAGVKRVRNPLASYGKMAEKAPGKDSTSGHWEIAGLVLEKPFPTYPDGFPEEILLPFRRAIGCEILGNKAASGTEIIAELGEEHLDSRRPIVYTSADSVFQVACHTDIFPLEKLYDICVIARELLTGKNHVGRVIARPFEGEPGSFRRTPYRKDYSVAPPAPTLLDKLGATGIEVVTVGKVYDLFAGRGVKSKVISRSNSEGVEKLVSLLSESPEKNRFIMITLVDFDMLWGHRNDPEGFKKGLEDFDVELPAILELMKKDDLLMMTADHGNDPVTPSTDHSREYVPLLAYTPGRKDGRNLGIRDSFSDVAATFAGYYGLSWTGAGMSFLGELE